ncbi:winged helix DNA-binding domain-containing protein [Paeniglutamicibacter antarcticus]|uniref:Winged helix DNA-binding domain-containing protein n=1 Tax=Paeniglutamicibacter antarcticus TaxID=494023 RepID=A0ABP9TNY4_9MICC
MTPVGLARMRLAAQGLLPGIPASTLQVPASTPAQVVGALGMMQAQDLAQACWAVGVRLPGSSLGTIHAALGEGSLIRCWGARGTLMFTTPAMHAPLLLVTAPRMEAAMAAIRKREGITQTEIATLAKAARIRCGAGGATRAQLLQAFADSGSGIEGQRGYHLIVAVCLRGGIVQGPMEPGSGTRQLFMATDSWIPGKTADLDPGNALAMVVRGYFESHGPATVEDCAWWLGLTLARVRAGLEDCTGALASVSVGGATYHFAACHEERLEDPPGARSVIVLPGFDEFLLGYRRRSATLAAEHVQEVTPGKNGIFLRTVHAGGKTVGTWGVGGTARNPQGHHVPFGPDPSASRAKAIAARIEAYIEFRRS